MTTLTDKELEEMTIVNDPELLEIRRPKEFCVQWYFNDCLNRLVSPKFIRWSIRFAFVD